MKNPRTIILAVVSAKNDYANQIILDHCRKIDEQGRRTLGIITKPDFLREGSDNELTWIDLALNRDIYLERGWHMLKNRDDTQMGFSFEQRNQDEDLFFRKGRYVDLPRENVGINSLRERLSKLLLNHLVKELPALKEEISSKLKITIEEIEKLGEKRDTSNEQRLVLTRISMSINDILRSATKGYYELSFFGPINKDLAINATENIRRFRAVVQHLNLAFATDMRLRGHKYAFGSGPGDEEHAIEEGKEAEDDLAKLDKLQEDDVALFSLSKPQKLTRSEAIDWVKKILERSRGCELPGTFQPMLISQLFWEQSQPWEEIALQHINKVASASKQFIDAVLQHVAPAEFKDRIIAINVDAALNKCLDDAKDELRKHLQDKTGHPSTYNHYFTATIQKMRQRKHQKMTKDAATASEIVIVDKQNNYRNHVDSNKLTEALEKFIEPNMDVFSSQEALDTARAFYKDELKYFVNVIAKTVIERHLVQPLPDLILSPLIVAKLDEQQVHYVTAESPEITQQRAHLESKKAMLEKGLDTFREAMGGLKR
jgi:hypothetical protein